MGPLEKWLLANATSINLQIRVFDNSALDFLGISDIEAEIEIYGQKYRGRGTAFDQGIALKKACSESIERFFLHKNRFPTSNGMATHINNESAIKTATLELIERDLFLCRHLTKTPFLKLNFSNKLIDQVKNLLKDQNINLSFYSMGKVNSIQAVLCTIEGLSSKTPFGYIIGTSSGDFECAVESAFLEAYRNFAHHKGDQAITLDLFFKKSSEKKIEFTDHGSLALDIEYAKDYKNIFFNSDQTKERNELIDLNLCTDILSLKDTPFEDAPLSVVRVFSSNLQHMFTGNTSEKNLNLNRLKNFCASYEKPYMLYKLPHPFN